MTLSTHTGLVRQIHRFTLFTFIIVLGSVVLVFLYSCIWFGFNGLKDSAVHEKYFYWSRWSCSLNCLALLYDTSLLISLILYFCRVNFLLCRRKHMWYPFLSGFSKLLEISAEVIWFVPKIRHAVCETGFHYFDGSISWARYSTGFNTMTNHSLNLNPEKSVHF